MKGKRALVRNGLANLKKVNEERRNQRRSSGDGDEGGVVKRSRTTTIAESTTDVDVLTVPVSMEEGSKASESSATTSSRVSDGRLGSVLSRRPSILTHQRVQVLDTINLLSWKLAKMANEIESLKSSHGNERNLLLEKLNHCQSTISELHKENAKCERKLARMKKDGEKPLRCILEISRQNRQVRIATFTKHCRKLIGATVSEEDKRASVDLLVRGLLKSMEVPSVKERMSCSDDLQLCLKNGISWNKRAAIKADLIRLDLDVFHQTGQVMRLKRELSERAKYDCKDVMLRAVADGKSVDVEGSVLYCTDVRGMLTQKASDLYNSGSLMMNESFGGKLWLCLLGDKGGSTTKITLLIGNVEAPNSLWNVTLLGVYEGDASIFNLRAAFTELGAQLNEIRDITFETRDGQSKTIEVQWMLTGDSQFISACCGHLGQTALHPCSLCVTKKVEAIKDWHWQSEADNDSLRSTEHYALNAQRFKSNHKSNASQSCFSVVNEPMFKMVPVSNIIPPSFHTMLGIGKLLFNELESYATSCDLKDDGFAQVDDGDRTMECNSSVKIARKQEIESQISSLRSESVVLQKLMDIICAARDPCMRENNRSEELCKSVFCIASDARCSALDMTDWVLCEGCHQWYHRACELLLGSDDTAMLDSEDGYNCRQCASAGTYTVDTMITDARHRQDIIQKQLASLRNQLKTTSEHKRSKTTVVRDKQGPHYTALQKAFSSLGADKRALSQPSCGNHYWKVFTESSPQIISSALPSSEKLDTLVELMKTAGKMQAFAKVSFLSEEEVRSFEQLRTSFYELMLEKFPSQPVTPEMHTLLVHVPQFLHRFGTWGMINELSIESLNARWNVLALRFSNIRDKSGKWMAIAQLLFCENALHDHD